jgi:hypothetical protein
MRGKHFPVVCLLFAVSAPCQVFTHFDGKTWWGSVKVLAADDMEGRETGSKGLEKAEAYIVTQLQQVGLQPAGSDGFYQPVKQLFKDWLTHRAASVPNGRSTVSSADIPNVRASIEKLPKGHGALQPFTADRILGVPETAAFIPASVSMSSRTFLVISSSVSGAFRISTG